VTAPKPSGIRQRLDLARTTVIEHALDAKAENEAKIAERPLVGLLGKLARKVVGTALILVGFVLAYRGLKPHDAWFVVGGLLLMVGGFFAIAQNDTTAFFKMVVAAVFGWRSGASAPPSAP
jgi:hypothetical protein